MTIKVDDCGLMQRPSSKGVLDFHISYVCTHACVFCEQSSDMRHFRKSPITSGEIARVLAVKRRQGFEYVLFSGGEPTLHPRFTGILAAAKKIGFWTGVISNGWRLADPIFSSRALPLMDDLWLSVHGDTPELHDGLTRKQGSLVRLVQTLKNAEMWGHTSLLTATTVIKMNGERVQDIIRFLLGFKGVRSCILSQLAPDGDGQDDFENMVMPIAWWREVIPDLVRLGEAKGVRILFCGLPLCALGLRWKLAFENNYYPATAIGRIREHNSGVPSTSPFRANRAAPESGMTKPVEGLRNLFESDCSAPGKNRIKPDICLGCERKDACGGVARRYLDAFGAGELRPMRE